MKALVVLGVLAMSGCGLLNPYESSFSCPETGAGKCVSVQAAYGESATAPDHSRGAWGSENGSADGTDGREEPAAHPPAQESEPRNRYRAALFDTFSGLLKEPVTPVVAPPRTMRVLLLPYTGQENEFYMLRYVYFFVDEPRWLLGGSVSAGEEE